MAPPKISVIIPSRNRLESLRVSVGSLRSSASNPDGLEIIVGVDEDDETDYRGLGAIVYRYPRFGTLGQIQNRLATKTTGNLILLWTDDYRIETKEWDRHLICQSEELGPKAHCLYLQDRTHQGFPSILAVNAGWHETLGYLVPDYFPFWWGDTWIWEVGTMAGLLYPVPIVAGPIGERGKTTGLREIRFWARFFEATRGERKEDALRLMEHRSPRARSFQAAQWPLLENLFISANHNLTTKEGSEHFERLYGTNTPPTERYLRARARAEAHLETLKETT